MSCLDKKDKYHLHPSVLPPSNIWIDFHSVKLFSEGQQEKDAHGVILGAAHKLHWKSQELDLMILVNSVQLRIVYTL